MVFFILHFFKKFLCVEWVLCYNALNQLFCLCLIAVKDCCLDCFCDNLHIGFICTS